MTTPASTPQEGNQGDSLWRLTVAPTIWAFHLLLCYVTAAVWCAKFAGPADSLGGVRGAIAWYTLIALGGIAVVGWSGFKDHRHGTEATTHDLDTAGDRRRFLGFATLLLAGLSALATTYAAFASAFFEGCV
jgi:hypothetical protein